MFKKMTKSHNNQKKRKRESPGRKITIDALKRDKIVKEIIEIQSLILIKTKNRLKNRPNLIPKKSKKIFQKPLCSKLILQKKRRKTNQSRAESRRKFKREEKELKKIKKKAKKKRLRKSVDHLTLRKTARAGAISI